MKLSKVSKNSKYNPSIEKKAFKAKMKGHYKGEFNAAALLRARKPVEEE